MHRRLHQSSMCDAVQDMAGHAYAAWLALVGLDSEAVTEVNLWCNDMTETDVFPSQNSCLQQPLSSNFLLWLSMSKSSMSRWYSYADQGGSPGPISQHWYLSPYRCRQGTAQHCFSQANGIGPKARTCHALYAIQSSCVMSFLAEKPARADECACIADIWGLMQMLCE